MERGIIIGVEEIKEKTIYIYIIERLCYKDHIQVENER